MNQELLIKARERDVKARKAAEQLLELKSIELYNSMSKLAKANLELEASLAREKELGQLKSSFVAVASHQFRTPLAIIQSNSELLEMMNRMTVKQSAEKYSKVTKRITDAVSTMTELIEDILSLGKTTSGNVGYYPEDVDLIGFLEKLVKEFNLIQQDNRMIEFSSEGKVRLVYLDVKLLKHSLTNLINNAFKYSKGKENPKLDLIFRSKEVILIVKDYGIGIPVEEQSQLFEPFFRANNVTEIQGTGLGLSIAKEYVELNKGYISAKSIVGVGSCFEITFKRNEL